MITRSPPPARSERDSRVAMLYRRYGPLIYSRCRRVLKDDVAAEDAAQEVFVKVMTHLEAGLDEEVALVWIRRVCVNYCLNWLRDHARRPVLVDELPDRAGDHPEAAMLDRDLAQRLLERVPPRLSAPALLYYFEGLDQVQVARRLGVSRRTVINRLAEFADRTRKFASRHEDFPSAEDT